MSPTPESQPAKPAASNLQLRVLTGLIGIVVLVAAIRFSEWGYFVVFGGLALLCQQEFYGLLYKNGYAPSRWWGGIMGGMLFLGTFLIATGVMDGHFLMILAPLGGAVFIGELYARHSWPFTNIALTFLGIVYTVLPFALLNLAVYPMGDYSWQIALGILILLWCSDTGAYFVGRTWGKTKLFERHSPKKSWEGFGGGFAASALAAGVLSYFWDDLPPSGWFACMFFIVVAGTYGDLSESMFKRSLKIKDSGSILPGHGGFLDRFDGLLIALLFVAPLIVLIYHT